MRIMRRWISDNSGGLTLLGVGILMVAVLYGVISLKQAECISRGGVYEFEYDAFEEEIIHWCTEGRDRYEM